MSLYTAFLRQRLDLAYTKIQEAETAYINAMVSNNTEAAESARGMGYYWRGQQDALRVALSAIDEEPAPAHT